MPKRSNDFQKLALRIYSALSGTSSKVEESVMLKEKNSDAEREIDILVTSAIADHVLRVAVECRDHGRDQDITWIDGLIGKFSNLDVHKVVAVSHTDFTTTAQQKAAQHGIELLTLKQAEEADWAATAGPTAVASFVFQNRPMLAALFNRGTEVAVARYTFEGEIVDTKPEHLSIAQVMLAEWHLAVQHHASILIRDYVFGDYARISALPNLKRYWEMRAPLEKQLTVRTDDGKEYTLDEVIWGIGTKYSIGDATPTNWAIGSNVASDVALTDPHGTPIRLTFVLTKEGLLRGVSTDLKPAR